MNKRKVTAQDIPCGEKHGVNAKSAEKALAAKFRRARAWFWQLRSVQGGVAAETLKAKEDMEVAYDEWKMHQALPTKPRHSPIRAAGVR